MRFFLVMILVLSRPLASAAICAADIRLVQTRSFKLPNGKGAKSGTSSRPKASWVSDDQIVCCSQKSDICSYDIKAGQLLWQLERPDEFRGWSVCRDTRRLAISLPASERFSTQELTGSESEVLRVLDCRDGRLVSSLNHQQFGQVLGLDQFYMPDIAFAGKGQLVVVDSLADHFSLHGRLLDASYQRVVKSFKVDAYPAALFADSNGRWVCYAGGLQDEVVAVRTLENDTDLLLIGDRVIAAPARRGITIGPPQLRNVWYDGRSTVVYAYDGGCFGRAETFVRDLESNQERSFRAGLQYDVQFKRKWIAVTNSVGDRFHQEAVDILNFEGEPVGRKVLGKTRSDCIHFSPSGSKIMVLCDDRVEVLTIEKTGSK